MKTDIKNLLAGPLVRVLLLSTLTFAAPTLSSAAVFVSVNLAPPELPAYTQPITPGPGYIWTPGCWAYGPDGYYWVPGLWVLIPFVGALWTPGYWGWDAGHYAWHAGYWGPHVGFYGGVNYGFGYSGVGYQGGRWNNGTFMYNSAVNNINRANIHNTYDQPVGSGANASRVSYNGGTGGLSARPTAEERLAEHDQHRATTPAQLQHEQAARSGRGQLASVNRAGPAAAATSSPRPIENHRIAGTMGSAHTDVASHTPVPAATAKAPPVREHSTVAAKEPPRSASAANHGTPGNANPRLASSHASNASIRPSGGAPHAQGPSQGGHGGGEQHEEGAKGH
jgi:hypothetical protein